MNEFYIIHYTDNMIAIKNKTAEIIETEQETIARLLFLITIGAFIHTLVKVNFSTQKLTELVLSAEQYSVQLIEKPSH